MFIRKIRPLIYFCIAALLLVWPTKIFISGGASSAREHNLELPKFSGRIIAEESIKWGGETRIIVPFEETENWGDDGYLTFASSGPGILFKAERPDPKTKGLIQHAEKHVWVLGGNLFRKISTIRQEENILVVVSVPDLLLLFPMVFFFGLCIIIFVAVFLLKIIKDYRSPVGLPGL